ncbi:MAG: thioredoxin fold domain-containing protein [Gammaproteobacteria bacterium]|nr:thioredoxin fold domain-containing protein [Gammaproteobacteria bacterium]
MRNIIAACLTNRVLLVLSLMPINPGASLAENFDDSRIAHIGYPQWFTNNPFNDLKEELDNARASKKHGLMILFTTQGCSYCDAFIRKSLGDAEIAALVQKNFAAIGLEIFDDAEMTDPAGVAMPIKQFAENEKAGYSPTLLFYDNNGRRILRAIGYQSPERFRVMLDYLTGGHYQKKSLRDYTAQLANKQMSASAKPQLKDDPLFGKPPYMLDRSRVSADRPLLVIFEEADCQACGDFHRDVLALSEVRDILKQFDVVRFDARDTRTTVIAPDGRQMVPANFFKELDFARTPALVFYDNNGREALKTDATVLRLRMLNSMNFVLESVHEKGWIYQRYARTKSIEQLQKQKQ